MPGRYPILEMPAKKARMRSGGLLSLVSLVSLAAAGVAGFVACEEADTPEPCTSIPAGGCPRSHGVACEDPTCEAVYLCRPGNVWELEQRCPPHAPPPVIEAGAPSRDASTDAPSGAYGGPGCVTLQEPECALGLALACTNGCCGCEDLFVCENGGWDYYGPCPDGGIKTP
jgi:hypothetical protein